MRILQELKSQYPNLDYDSGAFYESKDHDDFICIDGTTENIDADWVIIEWFRGWYDNNDIDSQFIIDHFGSFDKAFLYATAP